MSGCKLTPSAIKQIAQQALNSSESVCSHWLPEGKKSGHEWQALNPKRSDTHAGSFSVNLNTGLWADFATDDKGGDLVSLVAWLDSCSQSDAAKALSKFLGLSFSSGPSGTTGPIADKSLTINNKSPQNASKSAGPSGPNTQELAQILAFPAQEDPPASHKKLGKPSMIWTYRNLEGHPIMRVYRFDTDIGKEIRPLIYTKGRYYWKGLPAPRPLYNLHLMHTRPDDLVLVCEGEKAADAAAQLFPDAITSTPPNGAQSPAKADWQPLQGRRIRIWPDADEPGKQFADQVAKLSLKAGALSAEILDITTFLQLPDGKTRETLPKGWDAADAVTDGFTLEHMSQVSWLGVAQETSCSINSKSDEPEDTRPYFKPTEKGVYYYDYDKDAGEYRGQWICSQLYINAYTRDERGENWGRLLEFLDRDGTPHRWAMPMMLLKGSGEELRGELLRLGVEISTNQKARRSLGDYIQQWRPEQRARCVSRTGWFDGVFVLPESTIGEHEERIIFQTEQLYAYHYRERGTLQEWQDNIARYCAGNSRLAFAISAAFAALLIERAESESGGFHYRGSSSTGKTTALKVAASVYGQPAYMQRWRATDNGLEALAEQHNDTLLILDELAQIDPRAAGETAYMLANGTGKARAGRNGYAREVKQWRLLFLSAGELGLSEHMAQAGKKSKAGQEIRMADIPADAGKGLGIFEHLHGHDNGALFSRDLTEATHKYYGVAALSFIRQAISRWPELPGLVKKARHSFVAELLNGKEISGQAERVAARFGLVAVAGELATAWGITGWHKGEAKQAAQQCFNAWADARGGTGKTETASLLSQVRHFFEQHGEARFSSYERAERGDDHAPRTSSRAGFIKRDGLGFVYYVLTEVFRREVCEGFDYREAEKVLVDKGWLQAGAEPSRGNQNRVTLPGLGRQRCYIMRFDDRQPANNMAVQPPLPSGEHANM